MKRHWKALTLFVFLGLISAIAGVQGCGSSSTPAAGTYTYTLVGAPR